MVLMIDTTTNHIGKVISGELLRIGKNATGFELIDTTGMHKADQVWLISDTRFGFVSWQTKNIVDRILPLATMYLKFKDGQMRHVMRYNHQPDFGIIYTGDGDQAYLERWCQRTALNFERRSLGVFSESRGKEAVSCML